MNSSFLGLALIFLYSPGPNSSCRAPHSAGHTSPASPWPRTQPCPDWTWAASCTECPASASRRTPSACRHRPGSWSASACSPASAACAAPSQSPDWRWSAWSCCRAPPCTNARPHCPCHSPWPPPPSAPLLNYRVIKHSRIWREQRNTVKQKKYNLD